MRRADSKSEKKHILDSGRSLFLRRLPALMLAIVCLTLFKVPPLSSPAHADRITQGDIDSLQNKIDALEKSKKEQEERLSQMKTDQKKLQSALEAYGALANQYTGQIEEADEKIARCRETIEDYTSQLEKLEEENADLYENYKLTLRALRESRDVSLLEMVFNAGSLEELLSSVERAKDLAEYKRGIILKMEDSFRETEKKKEDAEEELASQEAIQKKLLALKDSADKKLSETESELTKIAQEMLETDKAISDLEETSEEFEKQLSKLIRDYEAQQEKERLAKQSMLWPLDYPRNVRVTSPYGYRYHPITRTYKFHSGLDLAGPTSGVIMGDNIYAAMDGTVVTAVVNRGSTGYGTYVVISHGYSQRYGGNLSTLYAHCDAIYVKAGDTVKQGQIIGKVGSTGASTGAHLHFEVRMNGVTTDPMKYVYLTKIGGDPVDPSKFVRR